MDKTQNKVVLNIPNIENLISEQMKSYFENLDRMYFALAHCPKCSKVMTLKLKTVSYEDGAEFISDAYFQCNEDGYVVESDFLDNDQHVVKALSNKKLTHPSHYLYISTDDLVKKAVDTVEEYDEFKRRNQIFEYKRHMI